ncbi:hypothetical protein U3A58_11990 [Algoriphagus sp. C2-6-M1]|uniref:hypothetical protein n=1 Tax=Algoriphagus persicinus TaxID=3108754 RepID=UPI002B3C6AC7|nr:hypothetical protein [Algoriphagus sp. C2-6-M1]MEB2781114.1 hypothetical protein [Algoriphagus sp. C2-6-M1]
MPSSGYSNPIRSAKTINDIKKKHRHTKRKLEVNNYTVWSKDFLGEFSRYLGMVGYIPRIVDNIRSPEMPLDVELQIDTAEHVDFIPE